ncbi:MAG TPA: hypothetical protein HA254_04630 [Candidatus Diapherotrites archaeon]|uniref:Uncharacterized protein n=1 Tax=Candidatus Iainarchaeum sp. TaxID=3101447 RepID=A0A7J4J0M2_9ARCH|nr:hypothetical protein [Candidatus Diapherotrites archaeon]
MPLQYRSLQSKDPVKGIARFAIFSALAALFVYFYFDEALKWPIVALILIAAPILYFFYFRQQQRMILIDDGGFVSIPGDEDNPLKKMEDGAPVYFINKASKVSVLFRFFFRVSDIKSAYAANVISGPQSQTKDIEEFYAQEVGRALCIELNEPMRPEQKIITITPRQYPQISRVYISLADPERAAAEINGIAGPKTSATPPLFKA